MMILYFYTLFLCILEVRYEFKYFSTVGRQDLVPHSHIIILAYDLGRSRATKNTAALVVGTPINNDPIIHAEAQVTNCESFPTYANSGAYIMNEGGIKKLILINKIKHKTCQK